MFGERLKKAREKSGMSQAEIARELGVTQAAYSYIENCEKNPSLPIAKRLAVILHTSLDYLVGIQENEECLTSFEKSNEEE